MLLKKPTSAFQSGFKKYFVKSVKVIFVVEAIGFVFSYGVWNRVNTNRDFRLHLHKNYNWALEGYYWVGETVGKDKSIREADLEAWKQEGKL